MTALYSACHRELTVGRATVQQSGTMYVDTTERLRLHVVLVQLN